MPISFYHGFETAKPATRAHYPEQVQRLLTYLDALEAQPPEEGAKQHVALRMETKLVRGKDASAVAFQSTDNPTAPAMTVREEDILKNYPMTYRDLADTMKRRYDNFLENRAFHKSDKCLRRITSTPSSVSFTRPTLELATAILQSEYLAGIR